MQIQQLNNNNKKISGKLFKKINTSNQRTLFIPERAISVKVTVP